MTEFDLPSWTMLVPALLFTCGALSSVLLARAPRGMRGTLPALLLMLGGLSGVAVAVDALLDGANRTLEGWTIARFVEVSFRLDPLAAFFLLVICLPAVAAALYGVGYLDAAHADHGSVRPQPRTATDAALGLFLAAMTLVVLADGIFGFLLAWELMALVSFSLVIGDGHRADARRAGFIYVVMTHIGTGFLLLAFLALWRHASGPDFPAFREAAASLGHWERDAVFLLALVGFGTKAGLIPLHVWLPRAHPAAPSHVSALMSGVMVKTAIYGLVRVVWEFAAPGPSWWGGLLLALGVVSAVLGILYALMERDLKRVLAYSTVEHLGIITLGLGAAAMLTADGHDAAAALALVAALTHLLNHSLFKGLLFLGAGAVQVGAGTRDLERLGGLVRRMPRTTALFLTGTVAIAALPPLNGFVGEWLLFQSLVQLGFVEGTATVAVAAALAGGALALTSALAIACFVRACGIGFLAQPRSAGARSAHEVGGSMLGGMALLALLCVALGLFPNAIFRLLRPVTDALLGTRVAPSVGAVGAGNVFDASRVDSTYAPLAVVIGLLLVGVVPWAVARLIGGRSRERVAPTWVCGVDLEPRMQYSATGFAKPLRLIFSALIRPHRSVQLARPVSDYFVTSLRYEEGVHPIYERHLYQRAVALLVEISHRVRALQSGSMRAYLTYLFATLLVVLMLAR
jgi:hydrogenase-4 component B